MMLRARERLAVELSRRGGESAHVFIRESCQQCNLVKESYVPANRSPLPCSYAFIYAS